MNAEETECDRWEMAHFLSCRKTCDHSWPKEESRVAAKLDRQSIDRDNAGHDVQQVVVVQWHISTLQCTVKVHVERQKSLQSQVEGALMSKLRHANNMEMLQRRQKVH